MASVFAGLSTTIFDEISGLARQHQAINLGQGFPDGPGPEDIRAKAAEALMTGSNQYPPMMGLAALREAAAEHYRRLQGLDLAPDEVMVTSGATEALAAALLGLLSPGDEAVLIEPLYDAYAPLVRQAGATPRFVRLQAPGWRIDEAALDAAITPKCRLLVLNNPSNPTGRVFDADEIAAVARVCVRHDLIAVCDEVWEHVIFDGRLHRPLIAEPGMRERTVKIGSAGKMFALTGWKVGLVCAAPALLNVVARAHQFLTFTTPPNLQTAVAFGLAKPTGFFEAQCAELARSRDRLEGRLRGEGFVTLPAEGTYFLCVDLAASGVAMADSDFCRWAVTQTGVAAIPLSAFYDSAPPTGVIRLCFAKQDATLDAGAERLAETRRRLIERT